jgi:hypothetical protein
MSRMADNTTEAGAALDAHAGAIDVLHKKLASLPGCDRDRLAQAVGKYKAAHQVFQDDALGCVTH